MISLLLVAPLILILGYVYLFVLRPTKKKLPDNVKEASTETGWPILGILPIAEKPLCHYLMKLGKKHGNLFRIKFGMRDIYVLNNYNTVKKCLKEDGDNFSGRWKGKLIEVAVKNSGILFIDGNVWSMHRSFMLKVLRDFGLGKAKTTEIVQEECRLFILEIEQGGKKKVDFSTLMPVYTVNIISKFIMSKRYDRNDEDFLFICNLVDELTKQKNKIQIFNFIFPWWDNSTFLTKILLSLPFGRKVAFERIYKIFRTEINNHSKFLDKNSEGEDFMDRFLIEQAKNIDKTGSDQSYTEFQLIRSSFELFIAGFESTSTTLGWSLLFLSRYQDIQQRMHQEIIQLIGLDQLPSQNDKKSLPLTQAVMDEILRMSTVAPLALTHRTFREAIIDGVFVEKDSLVFPNLYACHRDPLVWEKPFEFYPDHFLTRDTDGAVKYNAREELIPFSLGKRQCLGESLARAEFFIFLVSIIQKFKVTFADDINEEQYQKALLGNEGALRFSCIKDFVFERHE